jgi:putative ABC transport system substrate-binding protein
MFEPPDIVLRLWELHEAARVHHHSCRRGGRLAARCADAAAGHAVDRILHGGSQREWAHLIEAFRQGLSQAGFVEGRNIADMEFRWAEGQFDRLPGMASDLINRQPALIATDGGTVTAQAAKRATSTIPIIFTLGGDPVKSGLVASLNRPGGNLTGVSFLLNALVGKRLELLRELAPSAGLIGILVNPRNPIASDDVRDVQDAAGKLGLQTFVGHASDASEIDVAFDGLRRQQARALIVLPDATFISRRSQIVQLAARHGLPAICFLREFAQATSSNFVGCSIGKSAGFAPPSTAASSSSRFEPKIFAPRLKPSTA